MSSSSHSSLSPYRWAVILSVLLLVFSVGFFWALSRQLRLVRVPEPKPKAAVTKSK